MSKLFIMQINIIIILFKYFAFSHNLIPNKRRVLLIGIDGFLKLCMNQANTSAFDFLEREGSFTYYARTAVQAISAPGWSNILCGMEPQETGIIDNEWSAPWLQNSEIIETKLEPLPCIFQELKKNNRDLNIKVTWAWDWFFKNFGLSSIPDSIDKEYICDPIHDDLKSAKDCDLEMLRNGIESINTIYH